jgi:signal transduction histidine kinase/DNA-binding response OmpR family regulator
MKLLTLVLLFISSVLSGQGQKLDSLRRELRHHEKEDTVKVKLIISLCRVAYYTNLDTIPVLAEQALAISKKIHFTNGIGFSYTYLAVYHRAKGEWDRVADYALKMVDVFENSTNGDGLAQAYNWLGIAHQELKNYEKAQYFQEKSLEMNRRLGQKYDMSRNYTNLGIILSKRGKMDEAISSFLQSLRLNEEFKNEEGICNAYLNLGDAYVDKKDYSSAIRNYDQALPLAQKLNYKAGLANIHIGLAEIYTAKEQYDMALLSARQSLTLATELSDKSRIKDAYKKLATLESKLNNFKPAFRYLELYNQYKDSAFNEDKVRQFNDLEKKYETEKKEQTIHLLEQENKIKSLSRNLLVAGLVSVVLFGALIFYFQNQKNKRNKEMLKKHEELNEKLVEADRLKSQFFANISHEFRTPLTLILSPIEDRLSNESISQKDKISFQSIKRSANRLLELINQLLEQSKLESGFMRLHFQPGKLRAFMMPVVSSFDSLADAIQVQFSKEIQISDATVLFDSDKLEKILNNLLANAFKFSTKSDRVYIKGITTDRGNAIDLKIEVANSGTIIPPDQLQEIFNPFFQGSLPQRGTPGTGLGLSLVKELIKLHHGEINVSSDQAHGTIFKVMLTYEKSTLPEPVPSATSFTEHTKSIAADDFAETKTDSIKETILIVEDNDEVRNLIRRALEGRYNLLEAATGKEGVQLAREQKTDLVISDVMMPVMNGIELCHVLKNDELTSHIPVILLTARADHESKLEGLHTGADDYVIKPFSMSELTARVANLIAQRKKLIEKFNQQVVVQPHEITVTPLDERFIQKVIQVIENNLDNTEFNVEKLVEELAMSRTNLHGKLQSITGMAASEFIQDFRLRRAAVLIEKKADTISQIAYKVGFNDRSYFTKCFKKKFGKTPSELESSLVNRSDQTAE